ncbi:GDSL-type esterase/lipase family protein [Paraglaciecola sp.]|uniref:GDSL-type esterase/lipase family protein n=1 Tax=Paraglaciecola sp. TaxID=1920173 RepID=UPI003EF9B339
MKNIILVISLFWATCAVSANKPLSIQPDVQTAEWAVKWWKPRHQEKLQLKEQMKQVDLVFLGDSITHAWDKKGKEVWQQRYAPLNALNIGFSGDRTEHVLWRLQHGAVDGIDPKLLVLMIGTNNTGHRQDKPEDTALGIQHILDLLETKLPNTKILLLAVFPRGATEDDPLRQINTKVNQIIKNYHDGKRIHYLDINFVFLDEKGNLSPAVMKDLLHPNKDQYKVWAEAIEPKVSALMQ